MRTRAGDHDEERQTGLDRRELLRRGLVGGVVVWTVPMVSSIARPTAASAQAINGSTDPGSWFVIRVDPRKSSGCDDTFLDPGHTIPCAFNDAYETFKQAHPAGGRYFLGCYGVGSDWYVKLDPKVQQVVAYCRTVTTCCPSVETVRFPSYLRVKFSPCARTGARYGGSVTDMQLLFRVVVDHKSDHKKQNGNYGSDSRSRS